MIVPKRIGSSIKILLIGLLSCSFLLTCTNSDPEITTETPKYDLVLVNGTIVDGNGGARFDGDIGINDGRIAAIGDLGKESSVNTLDIKGQVVAPGFIDIHNHADRAFISPESAGIHGYLKQGVTTSVYGVDGEAGLDDLQGFIALADSGGMGTNFMSYIGHNGVRRTVMGFENRAPTDDEMAKMKDIVGQAMELGAIGLSTGLMYQPGSFATTQEVIELAKVTAPYNALYDSHVRDPANNLLESHQECLDIAFAAGVDAHPAHVKAVGGNNFGKGTEIVKLVEAGLARGQHVTVDVYPYDGATTKPVINLLYPANDEKGRELLESLSALMNDEEPQMEIPELIAGLSTYWQDVHEESERYQQAKAITETPPAEIYSWIDVVGYQSMRVVVSEQDAYEGRMVTELAEELGISPFELFRQIIVTEGADAMVTLGAILEEEVRLIMKQPWAMISSDGEELNPGHPRGRGTFPRVLGRYVREWGVLTLEEAIFKMSRLPASYLKMSERGLIREGAVADLVVFDPDTVIDKATWTEPGLYAEGISQVLIAGEFALKDGTPTDQRLGRFIRFTGKEIQAKK